MVFKYSQSWEARSWQDFFLHPFRVEVAAHTLFSIPLMFYRITLFEG